MSEPIDARRAAELIVEARAAGRPVASILAVAGPVPGARVLVFADGSRHGTLGAAHLDAAALHFGLDALASRHCALHSLGEGERLFCEPFFRAEQLIVVGAGHIGVALAQLGVLLGFEVTVLDDRDEFATPTRFSDEVRVVHTDFGRPFESVRLDERSYVVLVTRAHRYDFDCLRDLLDRAVAPGYIGMIGSRRRVRAAFQALLDAGVATRRLASVHAPVGLDIGAETPAEIAVSIAAELIRVRAGQGSADSLGAQARVLERFFGARETS